MSNDLIKRNLAIAYATSGLRIVRKIDGEYWIRISEVKQKLDDVPSVEERPQGKWIRSTEYMKGTITTIYKCSECGRTIATMPNRLVEYPFCHCGAEMEKGGAE